jgi:hypothetical protein
MLLQTHAVWLQVALALPADDPIQALTPIPPAFPTRENSSLPFPEDGDTLPNGCVPASVVRRVMAQRRFRMLTPHTILKSFHQPDLLAATNPGLLGVPDILHVDGKPITLVSNPSIQVRTCSHTGAVGLLVPRASAAMHGSVRQQAGRAGGGVLLLRAHAKTGIELRWRRGAMARGACRGCVRWWNGSGAPRASAWCW